VTGSPVGNYSITLSGASDANYSISYVSGTLSVTKKGITVTATAGQTKVYGAANPTTYTYDVSPLLTTGLTPLNGTLTRVSGEDVNVYAIEQNDLTTANNPNYTISYVGDNFSITKKGITVTVLASDKPYDGNTTATVVLSSADIVFGDIIAISSLSATFDTKDVGTGKTVTVSGISINGVDVGNYILFNTFATTTASITGSLSTVFTLPNAFTPNGDGVNTHLKIIYNQHVSTLKSFTVFNRNGRLVFPLNGAPIENGWDGTVNGIVQDAGVYMIKATLVTGIAEETKTGPVLLIK
jgi:gliding motility-associated-like protein